MIHYGFILYKGVDKNFEFCAPNKLYEYWAYGIPVFAHHLKGLVPVIMPNLLGRTIDFQSNELEALINDLMGMPVPDRKGIQGYFTSHLTLDNYIAPLISKIKSYYS